MEAELTTSKGNATFIPLHVVEEILLRLDVQTLFQCAFVCRDWNALITCSNFISRSSKQTFNSRNQVLIVKESMETHGSSYVHLPCCPPTYSLHWDNDQFDLFRMMENPSVDDFEGKKLIGVSNGLVCLASKQPFKFILWNPSIRKYVLPPLMMTLDERMSTVGFGFDRNNNDFKVVTLVHCWPYPTRYNVEFNLAWVFSYVTWSWKRLTIPSSWFAYWSVPHVFLNGVLYWLAFNEEDGCDDYTFILTFDLTHEVFGQIPFPNDARNVGQNSLVTTGDSLLLIQEIHVHESDDETDEDEGYANEVDEDEVVSNHLTIWIMKQTGCHESWVKIFSITSEIDPDSILGVRKNGDLILNMGSGRIYRYNPTTSTNVLIEAIKNSVFFHYHNESLYLLEKGKDVISY